MNLLRSLRPVLYKRTFSTNSIGMTTSTIITSTLKSRYYPYIFNTWRKCYYHHSSFALKRHTYDNLQTRKMQRVKKNNTGYSVTKDKEGSIGLQICVGGLVLFFLIPALYVVSCEFVPAACTIYVEILVKLLSIVKTIVDMLFKR